MNRFTRSLGGVLFASAVGLTLLVGCDAKPESGLESADDASVVIDEEKLSDEYATSAESEITKDNAAEIMSALETEIDADTGADEAGQ